MDYQRIFLIGNATKDAQVKRAKTSDNEYGDFTLAVSNRKDETTFYPVRCFGKLTKGVSGIRKGVRVFVEGTLDISSFTGDDGAKRMTYRVIANTFRILSNGRRAAAEETPTAQ